MVVTCEIQFDQNPYGTFFTGQLVNGTVTLKSDKPKDVKGVLLKISGYAITRWRERRFNQRQTYYGREDYMSSLTYLLGSEENNKCPIPTGIHTYNFACQLPYNCPTSFEGRFGSIRYVAKVVLIRPWKFDQTYTRGFTVLKMMDLNYETPQLKIPSYSEAYKTFCCGLCKTEPLTLNLNVPQSGFVPGQVIPVTVLVVNNTNIPVSAVEFSLVMLVRYFSFQPMKCSRVERITVTKAIGDSVLRNCTRSLVQELLVPATPPTCLKFCNLIQIAYQIEVEVKMSTFHANQVITMPITIGNVPLTNALVQQQPSSSRAVAELDAAAAGGSAEEGKELDEGAGGKQTEAENHELPMVGAVPARRSNEVYPNMPPPSYEESVHTVRGDINEDELHAFGPCEFAPLYPVYNIPSPTNPIASPIQNGGGGGGYVNQSFES